MMEMKLVVATILQRCSLDLVPGFDPGFEAGVSLRPKRGVMVTPRWRSDDA